MFMFSTRPPSSFSLLPLPLSSAYQHHDIAASSDHITALLLPQILVLLRQISTLLLLPPLITPATFLHCRTFPASHCPHPRPSSQVMPTPAQKRRLAKQAQARMERFGPLGPPKPVDSLIDTKTGNGPVSAADLHSLSPSQADLL